MTVCDIDAKAFLEAIFFNYNDTEETPVLGQTRQRPSGGTTVFWAITGRERISRGCTTRLWHYKCYARHVLWPRALKFFAPRGALIFTLVAN